MVAATQHLHRHGCMDAGPWGGSAIAIIGEVQGDPHAAEKPGNLVLGPHSDGVALRALTDRARANDMHLWAQLGHAGAMAFPPISIPKGPSTLDLPGLSCAALTPADIAALPAQFANTAQLAQHHGFSGVQIHAAHGFLLSQFLSPLFNKRTDDYGGALSNRMRLLCKVIAAVRTAVGPRFPVALKLNATDQLEGGFSEPEALDVVKALDQTSIDLIDISGGTYFPGAKSASDSAGNGPYFANFAKSARTMTTKPLMLTGGFKTKAQAIATIADGTADLIGLARALVLDPDLPKTWQANKDITFPRFTDPPESGVTAWYTQRIRRIGEDQPLDPSTDVIEALAQYNARDERRLSMWNAQFGGCT